MTVPLVLGAIVVVVARVLAEWLSGHWSGSELVVRTLALAVDGGFLVSLLVNEIPFLGVALLMAWLASRREPGATSSLAVWGGAWTGLLLLSLTVLVIHLLTWQDALGAKDGASTAVIGLFLAPFYGALAFALGFVLGLIGLTYAGRRRDKGRGVAE